MVQRDDTLAKESSGQEPEAVLGAHDRRARAGLWSVYAVVFVYFLGFHALLPLITPYTVSLGGSVGLAGLIAGAYSAVNLLGNVGAGSLADRGGRKMPLVLGMVLVGLSLLLYPLAQGPYSLLGIRLVHGLGAAVVTPASLSYIGDLAAPARRARAMAWYGAAVGATTLIAPPLAGVARDRFGFAPVFVALAVLTLLSAGPAHWLMFETLPQAARRQGGAAWRSVWGFRLCLAYGSTFCLLFSLGTLIVFLPLMASAQGLGSGRVGLLFAGFALTAILVQILPLGRLSDRTGREPPILLGFGVVATALLLLAALGQWAAWLGAMLVYGTGFGLIFPAMAALVADATEPQTRGVASGIFMAAFSLGATFGTASAGPLERLEQLAQVHPFQAGAVVVLLGALWAGFAWARRRH